MYFAVASDYSVNSGFCPADSQGQRYIYQARVLTGQYTQGAAGMIEPPALKGRSHAKYDSVVNNVNSPSIFVVFHDASVYPEYLITFK